MNHWTHEQDKRQLEMWFDRHPILSGAVTILVMPIWAVLILTGVVVMLCCSLFQKDKTKY